MTCYSVHKVFNNDIFFFSFLQIFDTSDGFSFTWMLRQRQKCEFYSTVDLTFVNGKGKKNKNYEWKVFYGLSTKERKNQEEKKHPNTRIRL